MDNYLKSLSRKRMGTGVVIFDTQGKVLVVKPSYKEYWTLPGGVVEQDESPLVGTRRELKEETNLEVPSLVFAAVEYIEKIADRDECLQFIFYGGIIEETEKQKIKIDGKEIVDFTFVDVERLNTMLSQYALKRVLYAIDAIEKNQAIYLENGNKNL